MKRRIQKISEAMKIADILSDIRAYSLDISFLTGTLNMAEVIANEKTITNLNSCISEKLTELRKKLEKNREREERKLQASGGEKLREHTSSSGIKNRARGS